MASHAATHRAKRTVIALLCLVLGVVFAMPSTAHADDPDKTVRVGWYESSFNTIDPSGRRSGYAYEYQLKIASYTGWTYEYVNGSWSELLEMLEKGEIDLMSDVSYTPEREQSMLFSSFPMGTEEYYLFIAPGNQQIVSTDYSTLNGKKVGVNKGSVQADFFSDWMKRQGVQAEIVEVTGTESESLRMLQNGELDAYVTVDSFTNPDLAVPVCKVGSSDFFFAVNKNRPDLLNDLESAMSKVQNENRYYNQDMFEKYFTSIGANAFLSTDEVDWLSNHGKIRVGYQDNYLAFCAKDKASGALTGALKDYLAYASDCMENARIGFEPVAYPTAADALDAMKKGEVDCVFPANLSGYDGETMGVVMTPSMVSTEVYAVVRQTDQNIFAERDHVIVAVSEGNPNYDAFLQDHFPDWRKVYYPTTEDCLKAVSEGVADCVLVSSYRYNNISKLCKRYRLTALTTGVGVAYCFAVANGNTELYSILAKVVGMVPDSAVNSALSYYVSEDAKLTFADYIADNLAVVVAVIAVLALVILALMVRSMRAEKKAYDLTAATEIDTLTGLYNRNYFFQYANRMYRDHPNTAMDAIVLNIERFHSVNALNGREFGDQVLSALGNEVQSVANENGGIAGRFGADRFDIYCKHLRDYPAVYERLQGTLDSLVTSTSIRLRMGVMPWQASLEPVQQFDHARTACSMARGHYKEHLIVYDEKVGEREMREQLLLNDLRRALDAYEFEIYYQPVFDIEHEPPRLVGAEALVRWRHPELGMILPDDFIPLFERSGAIGDVDKYVWEEVAKRIVRWQDQFDVLVPVSVNLSRVDVFDPSLEDTLDGILARHGLDCNGIKLEVTESAYTENADQVVRVVESLRKKGYKVAMDDFGSGFSSLNMLSSVPIDILKMDRAFVQNIEHSDKDVQLVSLIIGIAENLGIPVVAEGVENEGQLAVLRNLRCGMVQGYYFSRPLHATDFESAFLQDAKPER